MRKSIMLVFFLLLGSALVGISYGQTRYSTDDSKITGAKNAESMPEVLLQLLIRDADGHLLAYIEGTRIVSIKSALLNQYLDTIPGKQIIMKEGKMFELIQFQRAESTVIRSHSMAMFVLVAPINDKNQNVLMINHDAYQVEPGDKATVYWTIIRPVE